MNKKQKAAAMRNEGWSYSYISKALGVPKSTLSSWLKDISYTPNKQVLRRVAAGRGKYGIERHKDRIAQTATLISIGENEVGELSRRDLWMLGLGIWLGEGSKTQEQIRVVNSDPAIVKLFIRWLREICQLEDENITVAMHLYPDSNEADSQQYWQMTTQLPASQFRKTQIDKRLNKSTAKLGKSPHGTLHVTVVSNGDTTRGVQLYRRLRGWISAVTK